MTLNLTPTDRRATSLAGLCDGAVHLPGDPGYDAARMPWNVALDQRPAAVALPRTVADVQDVVRAAAAAGLRVAPQSTGHNAGPLVAHGLDDVVLVRTARDARRHHRPDPPHRPRRGRRALDGRDRARGRPRARGAARQLARRRHRRLQPRRRHRLVRPQARPRHQQPDRGRARHRRRRARARRRDAEPRAVLGAARWRRQLRRRHRPRVPPLPHRDGVCRHARLGPRPGRARAARWADWAPEAPDEVTTSFRFLNLPPLPTIPEPLRGRSLVVIDGAVLGCDAEAQLDPRPAAGARPGDRHLRPGARPGR